MSTKLQTADDDAAIANVAHRDAEEQQASMAIERVKQKAIHDRAVASVYPMPTFGPVKIQPTDPWRGLSELTYEQVKAATKAGASPGAVPPDGWFRLRPDVREQLAGLVSCVVERFPRDSNRAFERRARMLTAVELGLLAAARPGEATDLANSVTPAEREVVQRFAAIGGSTWAYAAEQLQHHGAHALLKGLVEKFDQPRGALEALIGVFRKTLGLAS